MNNEIYRFYNGNTFENTSKKIWKTVEKFILIKLIYVYIPVPCSTAQT